jgi:hypothetical protein
MAQLSTNLPWEKANPLWAATLNPIIANPITSSSIISSQKLILGTTTINHGLGRMMQGWFITDINGGAHIYRSAPLNSLTLALTSDAAVTVNIVVF